jgi:2-furoyl-CoA dehydrogenase FAD binding subunit
MNMRLARPEVLVDINGLDGLNDIRVEDGRVRTGALVRQARAMASPEIASRLPLLRRALPNVGHYQTRSRGTLAGSVAHADPSAEVPLCLATLGGAVELCSLRGTREVSGRDFAEAALVTGREPDEMIAGLVWPALPAGSGCAFAEISQRHGDFAVVAAAAVVRPDGKGGLSYALGLGGVEDRPRVTEGRTEAKDEDWPRAVAADWAAALDPMTDPRADAAYRRHLAGHLGAQVLHDALAEVRP